MPSLSVDLLWHELILHTEAYDDFCRKAYGRKLHHHPEVAMPKADADELNGPAMARTFALACLDEGIRAIQPSRLPVLFDADDALGLADGRFWELGCRGEDCRVDRDARCVWHELVPLVPARSPKLLRLNGANQLVRQTRWVGGTYVGTGGCGGGGSSGGGGHGCGGGGHGCGGHGCGGGHG